MSTKRLRDWLRGNAKFLAFVLLFGVFRTAIADWNPIPSASATGWSGADKSR